MRQVAFCFLTSTPVLYICSVCMDEHTHTPSHRTIICMQLSGFVKSIWNGRWDYSHLWLRHHFSVFTLFHIIYLLYLALFTQRSRYFHFLPCIFYCFPPQSPRCWLLGYRNVFCLLPELFVNQCTWKLYVWEPERDTWVMKGSWEVLKTDVNRKDMLTRCIWWL